MIENYNRILKVERDSDGYWNYLFNIAEIEVFSNEDIDNDTMRNVVAEEDTSCL